MKHILAKNFVQVNLHFKSQFELDTFLSLGLPWCLRIRLDATNAWIDKAKICFGRNIIAL
ncbi:hypothetical protein JCM19376_17140 [Fusibacter bizertensis]